MEHRFKLLVKGKKFFKEYDIPSKARQVRLGTTAGCELLMERSVLFEDVEIEFRRGNGWEAVCSEGIYFSQDGIRKMAVSGLSHREKLSVCYSSTGTEAFSVTFQIDFEDAVPSYAWKANLVQAEEFYIGDAGDCHLVLRRPYSRDTRLRISKRPDGYYLVGQKCPYGLCLNGQLVEGNIRLRNHDFFSVGDSFFYYKDGSVYFDKEILQKWKVSIEHTVKEGAFPYPLFIRNTRVKEKIDTEEIEVLDPSNLPEKPKINYVTSLLPAILMFAMVILLRGVMSTSGGTFVLFSICSMGLGVFTSVMQIYYTKKEYRESVEKRKDTYNAYIARKGQEIEAARKSELDSLCRTYLPVRVDLQAVQGFLPTLFDRTPEDEDFLDVYLGTGLAEAKKKIKYKAQEKLEEGDDLAQIPAQVAQNSRYIANAPVVAGLREANAIGAVGNEDDCYELFKRMVIDVCVRQYYRDAMVFALLPENAPRYAWVRYFPHVTQNGARGIVCDNESKNNVFEALYRELSFRSNQEEQKKKHTFLVIFVLEEWGIKSHPISRFIESAAALDAVFIFFERETYRLPLYCTKIIRQQGSQGVIFSSNDAKVASTFVSESVTDAEGLSAARRLAPVYCEEISLEGTLRKSITLFELLGIHSPEDLDLKRNWSQSKIYQSMAVPMGVNVKDEVVFLDLHEKFHGPHGLVAGTTGSGKSEILQTYILGAAVNFAPTEIGFLIIDFKGGGMANQFRKLPHLLGAITNIDGKAINRSLKSIRAELLRRQSLFAAAGLNQIDRYIEAYKQGTVSTPLPHLVIIVDEFAELKAEQPDFMQELISTARIGRSLGVHLILATQKPSGQVNEQIWSNSRFKLCLKVQSASDSNEVLKSPLAAEIREPGRAYLQVGNNEIFELFQSGYSGAPEKTGDTGQKSIKIYELAASGARRLAYEQKPEKTKSARNQLEALTAYVAAFCAEENIRRLPEICLPALGDRIAYDPDIYEVMPEFDYPVPIGIFDDPDQQRQEVAMLRPGAEHTFILGAARFGKTNVLMQMARSLAETYTPEELNLYFIDCNSMLLRHFENLNHTGGVATLQEDEKLKNLFRYLKEETVRRREVLMQAGVSSFQSYRESGRMDLPQIIVFIDNFTSLKAGYLQDSEILLDLLRDGLAVGISFVVTNAQTTGFGYKYMANFASRLALFVNDDSEYSNVLSAVGRFRPDEKPGRGLMEIEKNIYELQTFLAFDGERESDRVRMIEEFVLKINSKYGNRRAFRIPEIPDVLTEDSLADWPGVRAGAKERLALGLNYESVSPVWLELLKINILGISGREGFGRTNAVKYLSNAFKTKGLPYHLMIFDDFQKKLRAYAKENPGTDYAFTGAALKDTVLGLEKRLEERFALLMDEKPYDETYEVLILSGQEMIEQASGDREVMRAMKNILGKYKMLHVLVILGNIPNTPIPYSAPELLKTVKEARNFLFFDDLENCKVVDIPLSTARNFRKKLKIGDGYFIAGNDCTKVKMPLAKGEE